MIHIYYDTGVSSWKVSSDTQGDVSYFKMATECYSQACLDDLCHSWIDEDHMLILDIQEEGLTFVDLVDKVKGISLQNSAVAEEFNTMLKGMYV